MMLVPLNNINIIMREGWILFMLFFLFSSFVMADSRLKLNFSDEFYSNKSTDVKFKRDRNSPEELNDDEQRWRKPASSPPTSSRWEKIELLHDEHETRSSQRLLDRFSSQKLDLEPQFDLRF